MRPHAESKEFEVTSLHPGVTREQVIQQTGWRVRFADDVRETAPPTPHELDVLRDLNARTTRAHGASSNE
jgi:glutaconate CoA-transferase subunit B